MKKLTLLAAVLLAFTLTTCSNPIDFVAEVTDQVMVANDKYLEVTETQPIKNALEVLTWAPIVIEFDRDIDESTVTESNIVFKDSTDALVPWHPNYNAATRSLTIIPDALNGPIEFTITITGDVKGIDGSSLRSPYSWSFTTKATPSGTIATNDANGWVNSTTVYVTITKNVFATAFRVCGEDASGEPDFDPADGDWDEIATPNFPLTNYPVTIYGAQGTNRVFIQFMDVSSQRSPEDAISDDISYDNVPPMVSEGTLAWLNNTNPVRTTIATASDGTSGIASYAWTGAGLAFGSPSSLNTTISATTDNTYTATLTVTDYASNSTVKNLTVRRDVTLPVVNAGTLPWINVANASRATSATATETNSPTYLWTGPAQLSFSPNNTLNTTISGTTDGTYTATLTVTDAAGNVRTSNLTVNRDRVNPSISAFNINSNATYANSTVTLNTTAADTGTSGLYQMQFSNDAGATWSTAQAYAATRTGWALAAGADGGRTVHARVTDAAGNTSSTANDSITYDTTPPTISSFAINAGATNTNSANVTLNVSASDGLSGLYQSQYGNFGEAWSAWETYTTAKSWTMPDTKGTRKVYINVKDNAGNSTTVNSTWDDIILNARIAITFTQIYLTNDGDPTGSGEIFYTLYVNGVPRVTRVRTSPISKEDPVYVTTAELPQTTAPLIYVDPLTGSFTVSGTISDADTPPLDPDDSGTGGSTRNAPFADASGQGFGFGAGVEGVVYFNIDVQN